MTLPAHIRTIAQDVLTEKQMEAFELEQAGWGLLRIGRYLHIRKQSVAGRLEGAHQRLIDAGIEQDANGQWYTKEAA